MSTNTSPEFLQPLTCPLRGSRLIEASAGTGKTYTIAALYLRLVLGHGGAGAQGAAFERALTPPEILVVTFTNAATQELRDRIRARLAQAAEAFLVDPGAVAVVPPGQDFLHDLRADYPTDQWRVCARTLRLAAEWMDESAISTIHGWCYRMLCEHAFDSGCLLTNTLEADQRALYAEALRDYWRCFIVPMTLENARQVYACWPTPEALFKSIKEPLNWGNVPEVSTCTLPDTALQNARAEAARALAALKAPWGEWVDELQRLLDTAVQNKQVDGRKLKASYYEPWLEGLRNWVLQREGEAVYPFKDDSKAWTRLTPQGLAEAWKDGVTPPPDHPALHAMATLREQLQALPDGCEALLRHAVAWVAARVASEQAQRAQMGHNDLLTRLDAALQGDNGATLAGMIRQQFPVALIDEFQDTDPVQYRIFDAIYGVEANAQDTALILIGDPKQAIYAFRGADIHTYLMARRATEGRHATLSANYRSTQGMVEAVNHLFSHMENRATGQGAFLFRRSDGSNPLPFLPVKAQGRTDVWKRADQAGPALTFWTLSTQVDVAQKGSSKDSDVKRTFARVCAAEIASLLQEGQSGRAGFVTSDAQMSIQLVQPSDIAVLVNSASEAKAMREALSALGVQSVYLSERNSVFQSAAAAQMQLWLAACADPNEDRLLRAALGSATLALSWAELDRLNHDELAWEARVLQFHRYRHLWREQGVLPMLRHLLHDFGVPQRLLAAEGSQGERQLTDLLHLAELLQQASAQLDGPHALIHWLAEERLDLEKTDNDTRKLRLESDADLVKVVTVHKSKGLEYALVFLPFGITAFGEAQNKPRQFSQWRDEAGQVIMALRPDAASRARIDQARLAEDLRKLYVALTRARYAAWVGIAPQSASTTALGYLLQGQEAAAALKTLAQGCAAIEVKNEDQKMNAWIPAFAGMTVPGGMAAPEGMTAPGGMAVLRKSYEVSAYSQKKAVFESAPEPPLPARVRVPWWIASYSALCQTHEVFDEDVAPLWQEDAQAETGARPPASAGLLHDFPRGPGPGSFLHGLLEWVGRQGFARVSANPETQADLADLIARRCNLSGWRHWIEPLRAWLLSWLTTPWEGSVFASPMVPAALENTQIEMEFLIAVQSVDIRAIDDLIRAKTLDGVRRPTLLPQQIGGMVKGFMDLVFEHEGRYFIVDYKSNWLGPDDTAYTASALREAVLRHRYDLQYTLYALALHRLLRVRLPGYDYERHFGGAICLFLRGHAALGQGLHCERPPKTLIEALDRAFQHG